MDQKFKKWDRWICTIYKDVVKLVEHQQTFGKVQDIINANPEIQKPNEFYRFLEDTYGAFIAIGIRRQIKPQKGGSLVGLLEDIQGNPSVMSRERFVELYQADMQREQVTLLMSDFREVAQIILILLLFNGIWTS